jgi:hypothetical protein
MPTKNMIKAMSPMSLSVGFNFDRILVLTDAPIRQTSGPITAYLWITRRYYKQRTGAGKQENLPKGRLLAVFGD